MSKYDVVVIGGGPAGMMAAGKAAEKGGRVLLLEKNKELGVKLMCTGKGRCNITNNTRDTNELVKQYGKNGKFLYSALNNFGVEDVINFFNKRGVKTEVERGDRIFPAHGQAKQVLNALRSYMKKTNVEVRTNNRVKRIVQKDNKINKMVLGDNSKIEANKFIVCTGGKSYPKTGSVGDGYRWLERLGHTIIEPKPALTPVIIKESFIKDLEGLSLKNVEINLYKDNKKIDSRFGEAIFTFNGMSGPIILDMSKKIGECLPGKLTLYIDFKPALDYDKLDKRIQRDYKENSNKMFKNSLDSLLPQKLIPVVIKLSNIDTEKKVNSVTREERKKLLHLLKEFKLEIDSLVGFNKAIVTSGGVSLKEIDPKTMKSKIVDNLYLAGEILDIDGPTGGYNLQVCWSTGCLAGNSI